MRLIYLLLICSALSFNSCLEKEKRITYYEDRSVKEISEFVGDKRSGTTTKYYRNGAIQATQQWNENLLHGQVIEYFENGNKSAELIYRKGVPIDSALFFYQSGRVMEIDYFDSGGQIFDFKRYGLDGERILMPDLIALEKHDTITVNKPVKFKFKLGNVVNPAFNSGVMIVGDKPFFDETGYELGVVDTLALYKSENNFYEYDAQFSRLGEDTLTVQIIYGAKDSLFRISVGLPIFVKP